jgi:hypothetical protein
VARVRLLRYEFEDYDLPRVCARCGARAVGCRNSGFHWTPPWVIAFILFGILPYFLLAAILTKRMRVRVPYCREHLERPWGPTLVAVGSLLGLIAAVVLAAVVCDALGVDGGVAVSVALGMLGFIAWMFVAVIITTPPVRPTEITDDSIPLKGVSEEFVAELSEVRRAEREERDRRPRRWEDDEEDDRLRPRRRAAAADEDGGEYFDPKAEGGPRQPGDEGEEDDR